MRPQFSALDFQFRAQRLGSARTSPEPPLEEVYEELITTDGNNIRTTDGHIIRARTAP